MSEKMAKGGKNSKDHKTDEERMVDNGDGGVEDEDKAEEVVMKAKSKKGKKSKERDKEREARPEPDDEDEEVRGKIYVQCIPLIRPTDMRPSRLYGQSPPVVPTEAMYSINARI